MNSLQSQVNQYEKRIGRLTRENQDFRRQLQLRSNQLHSLQSQLFQKSQSLTTLQSLTTSLQSQLSASQTTTSSLTRTLSIQSQKLQLLTSQLNKQMSVNNHLVATTHDLSAQLASSQSQVKILTAELEMDRPERDLQEQFRRENEELRRVLKATHEEASARGEENLKMRREIIQLKNSNAEVYLRFQRLDLALREGAQDKGRQDDTDIKDRRIDELTQEVERLLAVIDLKNQVLARLDKDIYEIGKNHKIQDQSGEGLSAQNTLHFINKQLKAKSQLLTQIRQKYATLLIFQQKTRQLFKQYQSKLQQQSQKLSTQQSQLQTYRSIERGQRTTTNWQTKFKTQHAIRQQADRHIVELLWENQALHVIAHKYLGDGFLRTAKEVEKNLRAAKGAGEGKFKAEYYYATVQELVEKNRELMAVLQGVREGEHRNGGSSGGHYQDWVD